MEEMCLEMILDSWSCSNKSQSVRQEADCSLPYTSCSDNKCSVVDGAASCTWHDQLVGGWRSQTLWRCRDEYAQSEFNTLRGTQPVQVLERSILPSTFRVAIQPWCCIEHRLKSANARVALPYSSCDITSGNTSDSADWCPDRTSGSDASDLA